MNKEQFFYSKKSIYGILLILLSGLYPALFYYSNNYHIVNSWEHVRFFAIVFLLIPVVIFILFSLLFSTKKLQKYKKFTLPFLSIFTLLYLLKICIFIQVERKIIVLIFILSLLFSYFFNRYINHWFRFLLLLNIIGFIMLSNTLYKRFNYSKDWMLQPDDIALVTFKKKPNIYFIQPDGYANFSRLKKPYYNFDTSEFENYLTKNNFVIYPDFRSNYATTLSSNGSIFTMKHHYYNFDTESNEVQFARSIIISSNPILAIFKNNDYKTYFVTQSPYLLLNRPRMGYDYCNINYQDFKYLNEGIGKNWDVIKPLKQIVLEKSKKPKFVFIEFLKPWHIKSRKNILSNKKIERKKYLERLQESNQIIKQLVDQIIIKDPEAIIILMADHGGYVGMDYTDQSFTRLNDSALIHSIFTSILSIRWGQNNNPDYRFKTSVNVFRSLFSYLSENDIYLKNTQEDASYIILKKGIEKGVYKYIDSTGSITLKKVE